MLEAELAKRLPRLELQLELTVDPGRILALVGPSGAGKSTVLRAISGLVQPDSGMIRCGGELWLNTPAGLSVPPERRRCGFVFQGFALFDHLSALDNVAYGVGGAGAERRSRASSMLDRLGIGELATAMPRDLSGGERQRVALARALAPRPPVLLLDEPLSALDATLRARARDLISELVAEAEIPAVLVTHDFADALGAADSMVAMEGGRAVQRGTPAGLAERPATSFVAELTGAVTLAGRAERRADGLTELALGGGYSILSVDQVPDGPAVASIHPWEVTLEPAAEPAHGSQQNRLPATVRSISAIGTRVRVALDGPRPMIAEVTPTAREGLDLEPGREVVASWKAAATRLSASSPDRSELEAYQGGLGA